MARDPYEQPAKIYDRCVEPLIAGLRPIGLKMYPPKKGMLVLDVGCGTGTELGLYQKAGCRAFGIDLSPVMVRAAQTKLGDNADIRLGNATRLPYSDNLFDLVIGFLTLHQMTGQIRPTVLGEMVRVMKREGRILLIDYHPGPIHFPNGWMSKATMLFFEILAGREHFGAYRDFLSRGGLPALISSQGLTIETEKIVHGGTLALFLLSWE